MQHDGQGPNALDQRLVRFFIETPVVGLASAYLFGSHADGRSHRESDVDVAILLDRDRHPTARDRFEIRVRLLGVLGEALDPDAVDLVILNDLPPTFAARIVTTGRRVYCAATELDHAFVRDSQLRAADLAPFLRRTRQLKAAAARA